MRIHQHEATIQDWWAVPGVEDALKKKWLVLLLGLRPDSDINWGGSPCQMSGDSSVSQVAWVKVSEHPPSSNGMCFPGLPHGLEAALVLDAQLSLKEDTSHTCFVCTHGATQHPWQSPYGLDQFHAFMAERTAQSPSVSPASNWECCWFYYSPPPAEFWKPIIRCTIWPMKHS